MQFDEEKAVKILTDELCYAYCDNCWFADSAEEDDYRHCDDCHRKYQNWALSKDTAAYIVDRIKQEAVHV